MADRYFWQLIFIKYTNDNKRVFYPNFFSNGYFITSEEQMIKYRKYGNMFFIVVFVVFLLLLKFKIFKILVKYHLLTLNSFLITLAAVIILGTFYNIVTEKMIFKHAIKMEEKFWVNNSENVNFIFSTISWIAASLTAVIAVAYIVFTYFSNIFILCLLVCIGLVIAVIKLPSLLMKKVEDFTLKLEKRNLTAYAQTKIENLAQEKFPDNKNPYEVIEKIKKNIPDYIEKLAAQEISYEMSLKGIDEYIKSYKKF